MQPRKEKTKKKTEWEGVYAKTAMSTMTGTEEESLGNLNVFLFYDDYC